MGVVKLVVPPWIVVRRYPHLKGVEDPPTKRPTTTTRPPTTMDGREVGVAVQPHIPTTPRESHNPKPSGKASPPSGKASSSGSRGSSGSGKPPLKQLPPLDTPVKTDEEAKAAREFIRERGKIRETREKRLDSITTGKNPGKFYISKMIYPKREKSWEKRRSLKRLSRNASMMAGTLELNIHTAMTTSQLEKEVKK
jgi:hypothetical protein